MSMTMTLPAVDLSRRGLETLERTTVVFLYTSLDTSLREDQLGLSDQCRVRLVLSDDDFFDSYAYDMPACVLVDVAASGSRVTQFIKLLRNRWISIPMLAVYGSDKVTAALHAARLGCCECIEIPCQPQYLLDRIAEMMRRDRTGASAPWVIRQRLANLGAQERRVLDLTLTGMTSKEIASKMEVRYQTVDKYRRSVYRKMRVANIVQLQSLLYESLFHTCSFQQPSNLP